MRFFFRNWKDIELVCANLAAIQCPECGASGFVIRHGYVRGYVSPDCRGIRGQRIRCKKSPRRNGCGVSRSLKVGTTLPRRCFNAGGLWRFIEQLRQGRSIKAAWERSGIHLSLDTGYQIHKRLCLCQSVLRTRLSGRGPPPETKSAGLPIFQVFDHLKGAFGDQCPVREYQIEFQQSFLALI